MFFLRKHTTSAQSIVNRLFYNPKGQILISIIFGLSLAVMFAKTCKGDECTVIRAPNTKSMEKKVYEVNGKCYKYSPKLVDCGTFKNES